jgi:hypothetical protein
MNKQTLYTELSIQIATLEAKVDKILQLLMKPEIKFEAPDVTVHAEDGFTLQAAFDLYMDSLGKRDK